MFLSMQKKVQVFRFEKAWVRAEVGRSQGHAVLRCQWSDGVRTRYEGDDEVCRTLALWEVVGRRVRS